MEYTIELLPPIMPNYISIKQSAGKKQDGIKDLKIDVADLTPSQAEQYGELMKKTFLQHYKNKL